MKFRRTLLVACVGALVVPFGAAAQDPFKGLDLIKPAHVQAAKDFVSPAPDGKPVKLEAYRGRVVFLNFWATWCPPCLDEMASLEQLAGAFAARPDFALLAISEDKGWNDIRSFFQKGSRMTVLLDEDFRVAHEYGTQ